MAKHGKRTLAAREGIALSPAEVSPDPAAQEIQGAFARLKSDGVDVLWVLNDNRLLRDAPFLNEVWRPAIEALGVPEHGRRHARPAGLRRDGVRGWPGGVVLSE